MKDIFMDQVFVKMPNGTTIEQAFVRAPCVGEFVLIQSTLGTKQWMTVEAVAHGVNGGKPAITLAVTQKDSSHFADL
ncbi:MAG TPA: hypothetical protein VF509_06930 [Sphingobium sp.]